MLPFVSFEHYFFPPILNWPVSMHMTCTIGITEMNQSWIDEDILLRTCEKVLQVSEVTVTASNTVTGTILVEDENLARCEPSLESSKWKNKRNEITNISFSYKNRNLSCQRCKRIFETPVEWQPLKLLKQVVVVHVDRVCCNIFFHAVFTGTISIGYKIQLFFSTIHHFYLFHFSFVLHASFFFSHNGRLSGC